MTQSLVTLNGASAGYAGHAVLHDINLTISAGERIAVMGRSGAGKSTLLKLVYEKLAVDVALIPQAAALVMTLSVFHNVYMGRLDCHSAFYNLRNLVWPNRRDVAHIETLLESVDLGGILFAKAGALSGGQQQRTSVARALYNGRRIIIGDEPVSSLDRVQATGILKLLRDRSETIILALHDIQLALSHTDRIIVLDDGRIVLDAPANTLAASDLVPYYGG
jgi:phosphonate transport system ATP-binding protein